jgi:hypothetical protein
MTKKIFTIASIILAFFSATAQETTKTAIKKMAAVSSSSDLSDDSTKTLTVSGGLDAYYRYNFSDNFANNGTSFTNSQSSFELGMASVRIDAAALSGKVTATVDLGFGRRAEEFSYNDGVTSAGKNGFASLSNIKQAYLTYSPSSTVKFTMGKFATHVGYELVDAQLNRNYSMSYMFTNGPFFHTGIKADITAGPVGFMLGVTNYTDQSTATNNVKSLIAQVSGGSSNGKLKAYLNYVGSFGSKSESIPGSLKSLSQLDLVVNSTITSKFGIGFNATVQSRKTNLDATSGSWWGSALYLNIDPSSTFGITLRSEYIGDSKPIYFTINNIPTKNIFANTLSFNCKVGPLTIIPEFRFETSKGATFFKKNGTTSKSTATALIAAVYKF